MLASIIRFSLIQRLFVLLLAILMGAAGINAFQNLPIDAFPDVSSTQVKIIIKAAGMTPEEVEARITARIEVEMLGIPNQVMLRSIAKYGLTDITVDFAEGTDMYWARQQVGERLNGLWGELPSDISGGMAPLTTPLGEMFMFTIEGGDLSLTERRSLLDWVIRPALRTVPGVADVNALGGSVRSFEVIPNNSSMTARGVTFDALKQALENNNRNDGAGRLSEGEESLLVRAEGSIRTLEDLQAIVIQNNKGVPIRLADVADTRIGALTRYGAVTRNGKQEAVEGLVLGLRGVNARQVVTGVAAKLAELAPTLPKGVKTEVFYNRSDLIERAIYTVSKALTEAIVLVLVLLMLFLGNFRAAFTVALILPLAALTTFILMKQLGMSANLMSLGGLAIAIGMLVDAAVVVIENVVKHLADAQHQHTPLPRLHLIYRAVQEVATPVTSGILIIIIVFIPLLTLEGLEGKLFIPVAMTIVFALSASLVLALTVIPVLASYLLTKVSHDEPFLVRLCNRIYEPLLTLCLRHTRIVISLALLALLATGWTYTQIGKTFMPTLDEGNVIVQLEKLPSITLEQSLELDMKVQQAILARVPEVQDIIARAGSDEIGMDPMGLNQSDTFLVFKPQNAWRVDAQGHTLSKDAVIDKLREVLDDFPGLAFSFTQPIEMRVSEMLTGVRGDVAVKLFGTELNVLNEKALKISELLRSISGSEDVFYASNDGVQYFQISIDRLAAGRLGLSVEALETLLRAQLEGKNLGIVYEGVRRTPLLIRGSSEVRHSPNQFANLLINLPDGRSVPLGTVAKLARVEGPVQVVRQRGQRMSVITVNVRGRDLVGFVEEAKRLVAEKVPLEAGYYVAWGGQFENQQRAASRLALVIPIAIGMIFLLLFSTFGSVRQALLVLLNIPLAMIGGVFALWGFGEYLSVPASVGFIALLGIAVLNGVMMVSYFNQLRLQGMDMAHVVVEGAKRRLRPVLMTANITMFGLVPLLFATGPGSEIQRPLAIVVIGGLITSTILTLLLLPILYRRFGERVPHVQAH
jgi:cobalt-zinc-cadmium resistance protein CzcA